jgi:hypothetical protein
VGPEPPVIESLKKGAATEGVEENFELVIKGKAGDEKSYYELLFSRDGTLLRKERIVESSSDILIY